MTRNLEALKTTSTITSTTHIYHHMEAHHPPIYPPRLHRLVATSIRPEPPGAAMAAEWDTTLAGPLRHGVSVTWTAKTQECAKQEVAKLALSSRSSQKGSLATVRPETKNGSSPLCWAPFGAPRCHIPLTQFDRSESGSESGSTGPQKRNPNPYTPVD